LQHRKLFRHAKLPGDGVPYRFGQFVVGFEEWLQSGRRHGPERPFAGRRLDQTCERFHDAFGTGRFRRTARPLENAFNLLFIPFG
jgi:hypothetical protein